MSEERFDRIDRRFDGIDRRFSVVDRRFDAVETRLERLEDGQAELTSRMESQFDAVRRHMGVLHEEALSRIAAIPDNTSRLEAKMAQGFADLKESLGRRLDPLEATVRHHSTEIERLKQPRG